MKNKRLFFTIGGAALVLCALLIGAFFAAPLIASANSGSNQSASATPTTGSNTYCTDYWQNLANELHVSVTTLQQDRKTAIDDTINQMVKDGKLTQAQANAIEARVNAQQLCTGKGNPFGHAIAGQFLTKYRADIVSSVASGLHLTSSQLTSDLRSGKSLSQIATTQKISSTQLHTIVMNAVQSALNKAVSNGDLTQSQATAFANSLKSHPALLNTILNHHFGKHAAKHSAL